MVLPGHAMSHIVTSKGKSIREKLCLGSLATVKIKKLKKGIVGMSLKNHALSFWLAAWTSFKKKGVRTRHNLT